MELFFYIYMAQREAEWIPSAINYSQYSTCLEYLIAFIKQLPHNKNIKVKKIYMY